MPPRHPIVARALGSVRAALDDNCRAGETLLVAWSGGPDSAALLGLLELLARTRGFGIAVGHVNHGLRAESEQEARMVEAACRARGLSMAVERLHLAAGPSVPARARAGRRAALQRMARTCGARWIALGHTGTDRVETTLMHLVRGAGLRGLSALPLREAGKGKAAGWLRPILVISRVEARAIAEHFQMPFVDDPSNEDPRHFRVRIRQTILPLFRERNPRLEQAWAHAADAAGDAEDALDRWCRDAIEKRRCRPHPDDELEFGPIDDYWSVRGVPDLPRAIRTRMIRTLCLWGGVDPSELRAAVIDAVDAALVGSPANPRDTRVRSWDLHPRRRLLLSSYGIWVESPLAGATTKPPNH